MSGPGIFLVVVILAAIFCLIMATMQNNKVGPFREQHHLDADPNGWADPVNILKRLRLEQHRQWDEEFNSLVGVQQAQEQAQLVRELELMAQDEIYRKMETDAAFHLAVFEYEKAKDIYARIAAMKRIDQRKML